MIRRIWAWCIEPADIRDVGCWPLLGLVVVLWLSILIAWWAA